MNQLNHRRSRAASLCLPTLLLFLLGLLLLPAGGCNAFAAVAAKATPPAEIQPAYKDLAGRRVGILVWAPDGTQIDWPSIRLDTAQVLQRKFKQAAAPELRIPALVGTTFPVEPASILKYLRDRPQTEMMPPSMYAAELAVDRLIYVEIEHFTTIVPAGISLFRGQAVANVQVIAVDPSDPTRPGEIVFSQNDVAVVFPKNSPEEGRPSGDRQQYYLGTVDALTTEVVRRFVPYEDEEGW